MSNKTIKQRKQSATRKTTVERRKSQVCHTYELKIDTSRFSKKTTQHFNQLFLEAKWFRNAVIASETPFRFDDKVKSVQVKVGKQFEDRKLTVLSSQMKQALLS
ncbi:MAG: transposase, partial [Deltaproteobacteria bacterium]|nr:transposase [Deltaproteobacteria bacterium]